MDDDELIAYLRSRAGVRHRDTSWPAVSEITERFARLRATKPAAQDDDSYPAPGESWGGHWTAMHWPFGEKVELIDGAPLWQGGPYGPDDIATIQRAFPGWTGLLISEHTLTTRPADPRVPWPPSPPASLEDSGQPPRALVLRTDELWAGMEDEGRPWADPHFPEGTPEDEIFAHLETAHANRAPWGNAFVDDLGQDDPPRVVGVHAWCHRADQADSVTRTPDKR